MKAKYVLSILIAGFLALSACNPIIEELYYVENVDEEKPVLGTPTTGNPDVGKPLSVTYKVAFESNGGSPVDCQTVTKGGKATRPQNPTRGGYGFVEWYNNEGCAGDYYDFETPVTDDIDLYAQWSETFYTVTFDSNGGSGVDDQAVGENGTAIRPVPTKEGYTFSDWYTDPELTVLYDFDAPVTGGIILYAKWIKYITDVADIVAYLDAQPGGDYTDDPVYLSMALDVGNMTQTGSKWRQLLFALYNGNKYVVLDLSACTMNETLFDPISGYSTGKNRIVSITLPDAATSVASFSGFTVLKSFNGRGLTSIGSGAFRGLSNLAMTTLPAGITSIGDSAFESCTNLALTSLPAGITSIGNDVFNRCAKLALTSLPASVTSIGDRSFFGCTNLALTSLPAGITSIGISTFENCANLALTSLPAGITSISISTFYGCANLALTSLPSGLASIGDLSFQKCTKLSQISLPAEITSIGNYAFDGCTSLISVTCLAETPPTLGTSALQNTNASLRIEVPAESVDAYKAATNWSAYADRIFAIE